MLAKNKQDSGTAATSLSDYLTKYNIKWADNETKMTVPEHPPPPSHFASPFLGGGG